jgi:glucose/arabinose dehydrogenase
MKAPRILLTTILLVLPLIARSEKTITGQEAFADWTEEKPGISRKIALADLPAPMPAESVRNQPQIVARPANAWPIAPPGFKVTLYAGGDSGPNSSPDPQQSQERHTAPPRAGTFRQPRLIRTAPNGDLFLADSAAGTVFVLRGVRADGQASIIERFATDLDHPFGIAFYPADNPKFVYIANATTVVRFPYVAGDLHASASPETVVPDVPGYVQLAGGGHWTRDIVFTKDGQHLLISVGSGSNIDNPDDHAKEFHRADVLEYTPDGKFLKVYAYGLRNCVGEAINPITGELWCSTNERDALGNNLVPDYVTHVQEDGFYGWPWYYMGTQGGVQDPRHQGKHPELQAKVITPDVLVNPHFASLEMVFYGGSQFPAEYKGDGFACEHGSWNRSDRSGYEVIRIPMKNGHASGEYEDFLTGFTVGNDQVWGRPVGVTEAKDGSLFISDDGSHSIWHVSYVGR